MVRKMEPHLKVSEKKDKKPKAIGVGNFGGFYNYLDCLEYFFNNSLKSSQKSCRRFLGKELIGDEMMAVIKPRSSFILSIIFSNVSHA